ncbi:serine protease persephone [Anoplophora glabripennis]|uniref:serine protease persephone n=1 Tax=Anoplophora glabripennis TaxID=217634 RepID=UPI000873C0B8|nr:serine protease persephone [Anoplophora glabripennis]
MTTFSCLKCVVQILVVLCFLNAFGSALKPGDECRLRNAAVGLCKYLTDCAPALQTIKDGGFPEEVCDSSSTQFIICCEDVSPVTPKVVQPRIEIATPNIATKVTTTNRNAGEISKKKCKEYAKYVWDRSQSPTLGRLNHTSNTFECPFEKIPLIVGGKLASRREFPHMALIGYTLGDEVQWSCGGTLISENYVLTASHCLRHRQLGLAKLVRVGMTNQSDTYYLQERTVTEVRYHPDYNSGAKYNDIALLKLSKNVDPNTYARPACLHTTKEIAYGKAIATGWGNIGFAVQGGSNDLLKVVLEFFDNPSCNESYKRKINKKNTEIKDGISDDLMICAGSHSEIKDTCEGDSGGPLQVYYNDNEVKCMYSVVGVTSFGKACGLAKNTPGVYTRVSSYIKWIEDVVWPEEQ